jgi:hypothetical protein
MVTTTARTATESISPNVSFVFTGSLCSSGIFTAEKEKSSEKILRLVSDRAAVRGRQKPRFGKPKRGE